MKKAQNITGDWTEQRVQGHLDKLGLKTMKPTRDVGVTWRSGTPTDRARASS